MSNKYYVPVRYSSVNKASFFSTNDETIKMNDLVIVNTTRGEEIGVVCSDLILLKEEQANIDISPIMAKANAEEIKRYNENLELANKSLLIAQEEITKLNLNMRLLACEYTLDASKVMFTYVSDDRVDFRELLKVLAAQLHCRIDLRQIGSRDKARIIGGIGICGLPLCCSSFLQTFDGISINRAKNQMLALNIPKLSGQCGKLICCLLYEDDAYTEAKKEFPRIGERLKINGVEYKITSFNVLSKVVKLDSENDVQFLPLQDVNKLLRRR